MTLSSAEGPLRKHLDEGATAGEPGQREHGVLGGGESNPSSYANATKDVSNTAGVKPVKAETDQKKKERKKKKQKRKNRRGTRKRKRK
eukprot:TRINITY_DN13087_c0_g1_i1.p2 TRINITY_DN13087_c0_g1~~TRINITY_DN13087_c0_g1_i1.p2  ORF type:complete len:101 (-),score=11.47 TRINITY_DN13087_c0_g1_i1:174-437(-)